MSIHTTCPHCDYAPCRCNRDSWFKSFNVEIKCGNESMQSIDNVIAALENVIARLKSGSVAGKVLDADGNDIGTFGVG